MSKISKRFYYLVSTFFFLYFNITVSDMIVKSLRGHGFFATLKGKILDLTYVTNTGAAFSILDEYPVLLNIVGILSVVFIFYEVFRYTQKMSTTTIFWSAILTAGILGNLYERIHYGYVRDYIDIKFIDFPVFNISDIFITVSVIVLLFIIIKTHFKKR